MPKLATSIKAIIIARSTAMPSSPQTASQATRAPAPAPFFQTLRPPAHRRTTASSRHSGSSSE